MLVGSWSRVVMHVRPAPRVVLMIGLLLVASGPRTVAAQTSNQAKIAPALQLQMAATPNALLPLILETTEASAPFGNSPNLQLAQQAFTILQANGQAVGALPIIDGAAGYATAAGITAMSALSQLAAVEQDAVIQPIHPTTS